MAKKEITIPYQLKEDGSKEYLNYPSYYSDTKEPNSIFNDSLVYDTYYRGRSSVEIILKSIINNNTYSMTISQFHNILKHNMIKDGVITGRFTFIKRGANYSLQMLDLKEIESDEHN